MTRTGARRTVLACLVGAVALGTASRAQTPNCDNLLALHFARAEGLVDCDTAPFVAPGHPCDGRTANECAERTLLNPSAPGPAPGGLDYAYSWLCPQGGLTCNAGLRLRCADGTRPAFHHDLPAAGSDDWIFYLSGGGSCIGDDCALRYVGPEAGEMTTCWGGGPCIRAQRASFGDHIQGQGILARDPARSRFADWNRVSFRKCTYDAYRGGSVETGVVDGPDVVGEVYHLGSRHLRYTFNQLAAGVLPRSLADARRIVLVGNSGGGKSLALTGDAVREHLSALAPDAEIRFLIDAHDLPMIQTEALVNPTHTPIPPAGATSVFDVPWGGTGTLPTGDGGNQPAYGPGIFEELPAPPGIAWEFNHIWAVELDESCEDVHGLDAPECHDEMHVLWNHVTTPFLVSMSLGDSVWRDGVSIFSEGAYDWNDAAFADRVFLQTEDLIEFYTTRSELATGADGSGTEGTDPNDLRPGYWEPSVFVPDCSGSGSHTPLVNDDFFGKNRLTRCLGATCAVYGAQEVIGDWLDFGQGRPALAGHIDAEGWTWDTAGCGANTCNANGVCQAPLETPCSCPADCGVPTAVEAACGNGVDDDCDGLQDCNDPDCPGCLCALNTDCDDGDTCTEDRCVSGQCVHTASSAEGPLGAVVRAEKLLNGIVINWEETPVSSARAYRGTLAGGGFTLDHVCYESGDAFGDGANRTVDTDVPASGQGHYYLVSTADACGESSLGRTSAGVERVPQAACP